LNVIALQCFTISSTEIISLQCDALKSKVSSLDSQLENICGQLKIQEQKCQELENKLKIKESEWKIDKAALEEKAKAVGFLSCIVCCICITWMFLLSLLPASSQVKLLVLSVCCSEWLPTCTLLCY